MAEKVLIINQGQTLMASRLAALLQRMDIEADVVKPLIEQIKPWKDTVDIFVLFTGNFVYTSPDFVLYFGDLCHKVGKPLCIVGDEKELEKALSFIPNDVVTHKVPNPFDVKTLAASIGSLLRGESEPQPEKQILLVDDNMTFLRMVKSWLGTEFNVSVAKSGVQAIGYLAEHDVDLVLLDFDMPVMSGPQVLEALRSEPKTAGIPVIFLTGKNDRDSVMSVMKLKPAGYILKSTSREDLIASLHKFFTTEEI